MPPYVVCVSGDKGHVAELLGRHCLLLDDKEFNIRLLRQRATRHTILDGVLVRRGDRATRSVPDGYDVVHRARSFCTVIDDFLTFVEEAETATLPAYCQEPASGTAPGWRFSMLRWRSYVGPRDAAYIHRGAEVSELLRLQGFTFENRVD